MQHKTREKRGGDFMRIKWHASIVENDNSSFCPLKIKFLSKKEYNFFCHLPNIALVSLTYVNYSLES
jgi:hypothetical protein